MRVVLKVTKLENWLVADPQALRDLPGLFDTVERIEKQVMPDRADTVDAYALLKTCSPSAAYDKKKGAIEICKKLDPGARAARTRGPFASCSRPWDGRSHRRKPYTGAPGGGRPSPAARWRRVQAFAAVASYNAATAPAGSWMTAYRPSPLLRMPRTILPPLASHCFRLSSRSATMM